MTRSYIPLLAFSYFCFFGALGVLAPYLAVFLDGRGFNSREIGELMGSALIMRIMAPNLWAWISTKTGKPLVFMKVACAAALVAFTLMIWLQGYWAILIAVAMVNFFWNASLPQLETLTMNILGYDANRYARIRAWGSLGFIAIASLTGALLESHSAEVFLSVGIGIFSLLLLSVLRLKPVPGRGNRTNISSFSFRSLFSLPIITFWCGILLINISHGPYYTFFLLYLEQLQYPASLGGVLVSVGVTSEVVTFFLVGRLVSHFGPYQLLRLALGLAVARWLLLGYLAHVFPVLILIQLLHAASFALVHLMTMQFISRHFSGSGLANAQAFYSAIGFGLGGVIGTYLSGWTWHDGQGALVTFQWAAGLALVSFILISLIPARYFESKTTQGEE